MLTYLFIWYITILLWIKAFIAWLGTYFRIIQTQPFPKCQIYNVIDRDTGENLTCQFCWVFTFQPHTVHTLKNYFPRKLKVNFMNVGIATWYLDGTEYYQIEGTDVRKKFAFKKIKFKCKKSISI